MEQENILSLYRTICEPAIPGSERIAGLIKLTKALLKNSSADAARLHFELIKNSRLLKFDDNQKIIYNQLRASFAEQNQAEELLVEELNRECDDDFQADLLQILGRMRTDKSIEIAKDFLQSAKLKKRETALCVLGWVGGRDEIDLLNYHQLNEAESRLRITACSALRQIAWHYPELKNEVLKTLSIGYRKEVDDEVVKWLIVMIGTVAEKNLGLREDRANTDLIHGDIVRARLKTERYINELFGLQQ